MTTTTISKEQHALASERVAAAGMSDRVTLLLEDYRDLTGTYDKLVSIEMDCYWIAQAGLDPLQMFREYGNRIKLIHLKDRKPGFPTTQVKDDTAEHFTEVGSGTIQWREILAAAKNNGVRHMFVERDSGDLPAMESLRISFRNLQKIG